MMKTRNIGGSCGQRMPSTLNAGATRRTKGSQQRLCSSCGSQVPTPIGTIAEAALLAQQLPSNPQIQRLLYLTQRALVQLDGQHLVSSTRNQLSRSEQHGDTALVSHTPGGGHGSWRNDNRQHNEGHPFARGNNEQEVQQPPRNQHGARHHGQNPIEANLYDAPTVDPRQKINEDRDAQLVIEARRRDRPGRYHDDDDSDRFPAFTTIITNKSYPKDFKPVTIPEYDGKQDPR
jgi:hypothetical protein